MADLTTVSPQTALEAVNLMLSSIGERPVNQLGSSTRADVVRAENALLETLRMVQSRGWWFNRVEELLLTPSGNQVVLPESTLKVKKVRNRFGTPFNKKRLVFRQDVNDGNKKKLYNITDRSFNVGSEQIMVELVEGLGFEELPETARRYIATRAGVTYQMRSVGSRILHAFTEAEANESWIELIREENEFEATEGTMNTAPLTRDILLLR